MNRYFPYNSDIEYIEFEPMYEARGRRKYCKSLGLDPGSKEFKDCLEEQRQEDKGKSRSEKKEAARERRDAYNEYLVEKGKQKGFWRSIKKVGGAIPRNAFNGLVRLNAFGLASNIDKLQKESTSNQEAKKAYIKVLAIWIKAGGEKKALEKAVEAGRSKKPLLAKLPKSSSASGMCDFYLDATGAEETAAATVTSTPILIPILSAISSVAGLVKGIFNNMSKEDQEILNDLPEEYAPPSDEEARDILYKAKKEEEQRKERNKKIAIGVVIAGAVALIGFMIYKAKKK